MSLSWPETDPWPQLLAAIQPALGPALAALEHRPEAPPPVLPGEAGVPCRVDDSGIHLDPALLGPGLRHPLDEAWLTRAPAGTEVLALDRFRRTAGLVLEALVVWGLAEEHELPVADLAACWWARALAAEAADRADPHLGWLWPEAVDLLQRPEVSLADAPRRGGWFARWRREQGRPLQLSGLEAPVVHEAEWQAFGAWIRDASHGPGSRCPVPLPAATRPSGAGEQAAPLSHRLVRFEAPPAGLWLQGPGLPDGLGLAGGECRTVLVGSVAGGTTSVEARSGGPVGTWTVEAGSGGGRLFAAQGLDLRLGVDGGVELVADNAFAGPVDDDMLKLARQFGATGSGTGRWRVTAAGLEEGGLVFDELTLSDVTIHPRMSRNFALPGKGWLGPVRRIFEVMQGAPLRYRLTGDTLELEGEVRGYEVSLRLVRSH